MARTLTALLAASALTALVVPSALADDAPAAPSCGIRILRAPADLRAAVEAALTADATACAGALDVWLVPTSDDGGGVYVQARDRLGRVRERVVPDAATTATLLASWVEIDAAQPVWEATPSAVAEPPPPPAAEAPPVPTEAPAAATATAAPSPAVAVGFAPTYAPTGEGPTIAPPGGISVGATAAAPGRRRTRPFAFAAVATFTGSGMEGMGARVGVDLRTRGGWRFGVSAGLSVLDGSDVFQMASDPSVSVQEVERQSVDLGVTMRRSWNLGRLALTPSGTLGVGVAHHQLMLWSPGNNYSRDPWSLGPRLEGAITASTKVYRQLRFELGVATGISGFRQLDSGWERIPVYLDGGTTVLAGFRLE